MYGILCWKRKTEWLFGYGMVINALVVYPSNMWLTRSCSLLLLPSITECTRFSHIASPGKYKNSKLETCLLPNAYCFHTIVKLKTLSQTKVNQGPSVQDTYFMPLSWYDCQLFSFIVVFSKRTDNLWYRSDA